MRRIHHAPVAARSGFLKANVLAVVGALTVATMAGLGSADGAYASTPTVGAGTVQASPVAPGTDASEEAAALAEAARTGKGVEVTAEATETETVWANPDGTLTTEVSQQPVRVRDADGDLIDLDLAAEAGRLAPQASTEDVSFSATGGGVLADLDTAGATSFGLGFDGALGAPRVSASAATYAGAGTGLDVQVAATSNGFTARVVLSEAPTSAPTYTFPLRLEGLKPSLAAGVLTLSDAAGKAVAETAPLRMWDARVDAAGDRSQVVPVAAKLVTSADGATALQLSPSMAFLTDPATKYPVTVDPDVTNVGGYSTDTFFFSNQTSTDPRGSSSILRVGSDDGVRRFRAYEEFDTDAYVGKNVTSATLNLYQYYAGTARPGRCRCGRPPRPQSAMWCGRRCRR